MKKLLGVTDIILIVVMVSLQQLLFQEQISNPKMASISIVYYRNFITSILLLVNIQYEDCVLTSKQEPYCQDAFQFLSSFMNWDVGIGLSKALRIKADQQRCSPSLPLQYPKYPSWIPISNEGCSHSIKHSLPSKNLNEALLSLILCGIR